ncbi:CHC2 zinc finger domain-containing protein [Aquabacterium sp.]|uniref:CHC2 zinc finger domain-containing protein n=1 Tax=Aquabacterium sp. TaxID=1872578 RepID=UPI003D6C9869
MDRFDIGDLLTKAPLEDVVRRLGIETESRGPQTRALCPFHQDTKPSLNLYPAGGNSPEHYHCFACGAHGNAIDLVKQIEGLDFLPAVQWLAQQFGIRSPRRRSSRKVEHQVTSELALDFALRIFNEHHDSQRFKAWCEERAFDATFLHDQGLRCITRAVLVEGLQAKSVGERAELIDGLQTLGLIKRLRSMSKADQLKLDLADQFHDYFHDGRVVIPIRNAEAKRSVVVGFAGRALQNVPPEGVPKYLLTAGFEKAKHLFNAAAAFAAVREKLKSGEPATLYLVEGFLDALRLQYLGQDAVALMGISLSKEQFNLLQNLVDDLPSSQAAMRLGIFLDNDPAGFGGTDRLVRALLGMSGVDVRWVGTPWRTQPALGKDPDTCLSGTTSPEEAAEWLQSYDLPAEAVLLVSALGSQDASDLQNQRWSQLSATGRERALFRAALAVKKLHGNRTLDHLLLRLTDSPWSWTNALHELLSREGSGKPPIGRGIYLEGAYERAALAQTLAYHGARRGELPCDEEVWLTLSGNARLFDQTALARLQAAMSAQASRWLQAAPFDAVHLPRKLTADTKVLDDPRRKVMPHPADLQLQQLLLNELLTQRHDRLNASGQTFSASIPAVRWYASRNTVEVTGPYVELNEPRIEEGEPETLSFGYQIDMDVLEGDKTPSDQGMFRPFGQCWRDFMGSLTKQCHAIGPRVHVLRLDAKRYYDTIQRYVVRDALLEPLRAVLTTSGIPEGLADVFGLTTATVPAEYERALDQLLSDLLFGHEFRDPQRKGAIGKIPTQHSDEAIGIPQGPVLSAYIGTIALFPVDHVARRFIRDTADTGSDGVSRPRAGYARYVDDIVLFAETEALLKELREKLQFKANERSISLIHKGDRVRAGSPVQVMRQLNEGRGLAASMPAWEPPLVDELLVGDGEAGWGLGGDMPTVDRQCALKMLRHPALMTDPKGIEAQVKAAMQAPDLRPNDLGLCSRWLWWQVASELDGDGSTAWQRYRELWKSVCEGREWADAFEQRGYDLLYAVEGLDKLMDANPWMENDQTLAELPKSRDKRKHLAALVSHPNFFEDVHPAENWAHVRRRARLVAQKARRLANNSPVPYNVEGQLEGEVSAIEWLCLAAERIGAVASCGDAADLHPLVSLERRRLRPSIVDSGDQCVEDVCLLLRPNGEPIVIEKPDDASLGLAIDFVLSSAPRGQRLDVLAKFPKLLVKASGGVPQRSIPHLPVVKDGQDGHEAASLYAIDEPRPGIARHLFRYAVPALPTEARYFVQVPLQGDESNWPSVEALSFESLQNPSERLGVERSKDALPWVELADQGASPPEPITHKAARLFEALCAMHGGFSPENDQGIYVPFRPQLFRADEGDKSILHLVADPVDRKLLGANAWFHNHDDRVKSVIVPKDQAHLWRMGWTVADVLGVAADMAGETGHRDEQLTDDAVELDEQEDVKSANQSTQIEQYVLRQQLRKLQGAFVSEGEIGPEAPGTTALPGTVKRALKLLRDFPANRALDQQVRHLLVVEAETRAMALRLRARRNEDLRLELHRVFPEVLDRLPFWALEGLSLGQPSVDTAALRPELGLMLALYQALFPQVASAEVETKAPPLRIALALATTGFGLRGSVAALWGLTAKQGTRRMPERFNLPATWAMPNMARLDPQFDYSAMRKWLFDASWPDLCRASPWHWMLALIGLLDSSFPQAFKLEELKDVYSTLSAWQSEPGAPDEVDQTEAIWPFDALPRFTLKNCEALTSALPVALRELDKHLGLYLVRQRAQHFRRSLHSDEFTDASDASWQIAKPQFTGLGREGVERQLEGARKLSVWTETRSNFDDELLAVHTLDSRLGQWMPTWPKQSAQDHKAAPAPSDPAAVHDEPTTAMLEASTDQAVLPQPDDGVQVAGIAEEASTPKNGALDQDIVDKLRFSQSASRIKRIDRNDSSDHGKARAGSHFRVALFQWRSDESYAHPISEVGLKSFPFSKSSLEELRGLLTNVGDLGSVDGAARRGSEFKWGKDIRVISWPEHRRRSLLREALKACHELGVELLVLPEVSVRSETVDWLKDELRQHYPGLAVLAGTYRQFGQEREDTEHLQEKLTLLWKPEPALARSLGLEGDSEPLHFQRGKKYRAVAAHEFFRPDLLELAPLYGEEQLFEKLRELRAKERKGEWSSTELAALVRALVHETPKLRYCMELICSELFLLTSPANRMPLERDMAKVFKHFGLDPANVRKQVSNDIEAIGELLTVAQSNRERRSVLVVPACTSRSNDYWHAGQASVLASGTATVFCNAANKLGVGGSCFIGIDSVSQSSDSAGIVHFLTPYHGWLKGILQNNGTGALSKSDQALVVVDLDPVHVVSGKPRPQLLPEPMSLVAYLPVVEVVDKTGTAEGIVIALGSELKDSDRERVKSLFHADAFPPHCGSLHEKEDFFQAFNALLDAKRTGLLSTTAGGATLDKFADFFGEPDAVRQRIMAWLKDRHQQPAPKAGDWNLEPAWLDFLVADLTYGREVATVRVPSWMEVGF